MLEMNNIIKTLATIYGEITHILEELICGCYFDDMESVMRAIMTKEYRDMQEHDYCEKILKLCKNFEDKHNKLEDICEEIMQEQFSFKRKKFQYKFLFQYNFFFNDFYFR